MAIEILSIFCCNVKLVIIGEDITVNFTISTLYLLAFAIWYSSVQTLESQSSQSEQLKRSAGRGRSSPKIVFVILLILNVIIAIYVL